jgi:alkylation response protein AidB-like acyl-CoA dehydrogenase
MSDDALLEVAQAMADVDHPVKVAASEWARENIGHRDLIEADRESLFGRDDWNTCADHGVLATMVPTELGGAGGSLTTALLTLEGLGHGCADNGLTFAMASQILSTQLVLERYGTLEQQQRWMPGLLDGSLIGAFAMTEPDAGSDAFSMSATAEPLPGGGYRLDGHKAYITFGPVCDVCIVFASTRPGSGSWGISAFLVPTDLPGVERGEVRPKMGMRTTPFGDLRFHSVVLPPEALIGREGSGASIFSATLDVERSFIFAPQVGGMQRQLEETLSYAREREQGGHAIAQYQAVGHRLAAMKERHERARLFLYRAALAEARGDRLTMAASLAKIVACDAAIQSSLDAAVIHGAKGYLPEFGGERQFRDSVGGLVYSGSTDVLRTVVARLLGAG